MMKLAQINGEGKECLNTGEKLNWVLTSLRL